MNEADSINKLTEQPDVSEAEIYAEIRKEYPEYPVGFQFGIAMQMLQETGARLARESAERRKLH
jgi:hypothetical protein